MSGLPRGGRAKRLKDQESVSIVMSSTNSGAGIITRPWPLPRGDRELLPCGIAAVAMLPPSPLDMRRGRLSKRLWREQDHYAA